MSREYRAVLAYGKYFNSVEDASQHMIECGVINMDEKDDFEIGYEIDGIQYIVDDEGGGILGIEIDPRTLYHEVELVKLDCEKLDVLIGGCDMHKFIYSFWGDSWTYYIIQ